MQFKTHLKFQFNSSISSTTSAYIIFLLNTILHYESNKIWITIFGFILHEIWILQHSKKICEINKEKPKTKTKTRHWAGYTSRGPLTRQRGPVKQRGPLPPAACSRARPALGLPPARATDERVPRVSETRSRGATVTTELTTGGSADEIETTIRLTAWFRTECGATMTQEVAGEYSRPVKADDGVPVAVRRRRRAPTTSTKHHMSLTRSLESYGSEKAGTRRVLATPTMAASNSVEVPHMAAVAKSANAALPSLRRYTEGVERVEEGARVLLPEGIGSRCDDDDARARGSTRRQWRLGALPRLGEGERERAGREWGGVRRRGALEDLAAWLVGPRLAYGRHGVPTRQHCPAASRPWLNSSAWIRLNQGSRWPTDRQFSTPLISLTRPN
jgi:hypothetical protein